MCGGSVGVWAALLLSTPSDKASAWCGAAPPSWAYFLPWDEPEPNSDLRPRLVGDASQEAERGVAPVLVLGAPGLPYDYLENLEALSVSGRRVVELSYPPAKPADASVVSAAERVASTCARLGIREANLVAHGLGAPVALQLLRTSALGVASLTLVSPYATVADLKPAAREAAEARGIAAAAALLPSTVSAARDTCIAEASRGADADAWLRASLGARDAAPLGGDGLGKALSAVAPRTPTLVCWGGASDIVDGSGWSDGLPSNARIQLLDGAGHLPFVERPESFTRFALDWLDEAEGKETPRELKFSNPLKKMR